MDMESVKRKRFWRTAAAVALWALNVPLIFAGVTFVAVALAALVPPGPDQAAALTWKSFRFWLALGTGLGLAFFPFWFCSTFTRAMRLRNEQDADRVG
jgi:hypothetical protein